MEQRRIVFAQIPPLLADLVRRLLDEQTEVWLLPSAKSADLIATATRAAAHIVVVSNEHYGNAEARTGLSRQLRGVRLVALDKRGRSGERYTNGRLELEAEDLSPAELRALLRV